MRALWLFVFLVAADSAIAYERHLSPNGKFEAYTTGNFPNGGGMKLFVRRVQAHDPWVLLAQNGRWIDAEWSPDSQFLSVIDHPDGHITDVYVFGVTAANADPPTVALLYGTPNPGTYDVQWDVVEWHAESREIVLKQEVRDQNRDGGDTRCRCQDRGRTAKV
jgi:hypothetical protein